MSTILTENSKPFFIVPEYQKSSRTYQEILDGWISDISPFDIFPSESPSFNPIFFSSPEVSSSMGRFISVYTSHCVFGFWNRISPYPSNSVIKKLSFSGVDDISGLPWDPLNFPSVLICLAPNNETGYMTDIMHRVSSKSRIMSFRFLSNINPTIVQNISIRLYNTGIMKILLNSTARSQVRFFQINQSNGNVQSGGIINTVENNSTGVFSNTVRVVGSSFYQEDGERPDLVLCRSWDSHRRNISEFSPGQEGEWEFDIPSPEYDMTFIRNGCQPITHGPFSVQ